MRPEDDDNGSIQSEAQEAAPNPFHIPGDDEIFRHREEERIQKEETRRLVMNQTVDEKTTFASRMQATTTKEARELLRELREGRNRSRQEAATVAASSSAPERRKEKENMADFIAKKREIFLLQMSLDTKRSEIKKLEERSRQREEALKKSEQMLEEDALRFDAFLKENDEKLSMAFYITVKTPEVLQVKCLDTAIAAPKWSTLRLHCTARISALGSLGSWPLDLGPWISALGSLGSWPSDLGPRITTALPGSRPSDLSPQIWPRAVYVMTTVLEIKRLNTAIAALRSEMNKYEEQLEDCRKYKEFLDSITPQEWFDQQRKEMALAAKAKSEGDYANARTQQEAERAERGIKDAITNLKEAMKEKEPPAPSLDFEINPDEEEMFFAEPAQLLSIYQELEESNLFYIQNAQETEEALEELRTKYRDTKVKMDAEVDSLNTHIAGLQDAIIAAKGKGQRLKDRTIENVGGLTLSMGNTGNGGSGVSLDQLTSKVADVYVRGGFDADKSVGTLQMLTNIESKLEEFLGAADIIPSEYVDAMEKAREKERRKMARDEKLSLQQHEHEARMQRALERASAPVFKKTGKPVMGRSQPLKKKAVIKEDDGNDDEAELAAYLARDML
eukprot:gene4936-34707_t